MHPFLLRNACCASVSGSGLRYRCICHLSKKEKKGRNVEALTVADRAIINSIQGRSITPRKTFSKIQRNRYSIYPFLQNELHVLSKKKKKKIHLHILSQFSIDSSDTDSPTTRAPARQKFLRFTARCCKPVCKPKPRNRPNRPEKKREKIKKKREKKSGKRARKKEGGEKKKREKGKRKTNFRRVHPFLFCHSSIHTSAGRKQVLLLRTAASATN